MNNIYWILTFQLFGLQTMIQCFNCPTDKYETAVKKCKKLEYTSNLSTFESDVERTGRHDRCKKVIHDDESESPKASTSKKQSKSAKPAHSAEVQPTIALPQAPAVLVTSMYGKTFLCNAENYEWHNFSKCLASLYFVEKSSQSISPVTDVKPSDDDD